MDARRLIAIASVAAALAAPPAATAGPAEDFGAIFNDWKGDQTITQCRFSLAQLENAAFLIPFVPELAYTDFPAEVARQLSRWRTGRCDSANGTGEADRRGNDGGGAPDRPAGQRPPSPSQRAGSQIGPLRIVRVAPRGRAAREFVKIENSGASTISLRGARLRNRRRVSVRIPRVTVPAGATVIVRVGCATGRRTPSSSRRTAYACFRRSALLADAGDVAQLLDSRGVVISQRGFGRYRRAIPF